MDDKCFCLLREPWIRVVDEKATVSEVSLLEVFENAHIYIDLAGEIPMQNVAMYRFLLSIVNTVLLRYDERGKKRQLNTADDVLEYYEKVWCDGKLPNEAFRCYLNEYEDCFWLIHPEKPFYQVPSSIGEKIGTQCSAAKLNGEMFESNNQLQLFAGRSGKEKTELSYSEASRWLLFINAFDDCAAKNPSPNECWVSKLGITIAKGKNLFDNLMLNCQLLTNDLECWPENHPCWESIGLMDYDLKEKRQIPPPKGIAELFSIRSRRVYLDISNHDTVTGYRITAGVNFEGKNYFVEPMTPWKHIEAKKGEAEYWIPQKYDINKKVWQEFPAFISLSDDNCVPGIVRWINLIQHEDVGILKKEYPVSFEICSVNYGSMCCKIAGEIHDALTFHASVLDLANRKLIRLIQEMVSITEQAASAIGKMSWRIRLAAGDIQKSSSDNEVKEFYYRIDPLFRSWICKLTEDGENSIEDLKAQWRKQAKILSLNYGKELVFLSSDKAFVGRYVNLKNDKVEHYSVPEAYNIFLKEVNELFEEGGE